MSDFEQTLLDGAAVVALKGKIDSVNAQSICEGMLALVDRGHPRLVVDLGELTYVSSAGFRALLLAGKQAHKAGGGLMLCRVEGRVRHLFSLGGFLDLFPVAADPETALAQFARA